MSTAPTGGNSNKDKHAAEPKVKDKFLDKLVEVLGYEQGVKIYQQGEVTEQEITDFIALIKKLGIYTKVTGRR
jgi:hypothetical protein